MIPHPLRSKGGAAQLGATAPGEEGPFGIYRTETPVDRPVLERWLRGASSRHPVLAWQDQTDDHYPALDALDALEEILSGLEARDAGRWKKKHADFAARTTVESLLDDRAEYVLARALDAGDIAYRLGNTKTPNPDFICSVDGCELGIEVTSVSPAGVGGLCERIEEDVLASHPGLGATLAFSAYPSRLQSATVAEVCDALAARAASGDFESAAEVPVDDAKNIVPITITARLTPGSGISWTVAAGELTDPLGSAEYAILQAGQGDRKAAQGRSLPGRVILAVDISRYGAAWLRPARIWAQMLAQAMGSAPGVDADYPFAAVAVLRQSLVDPDLVGIAVALSPHAAPAAQEQIRNLCEALSWPHA
ncbi:hypothetical protein [Streptomyces sp. NPDC048496]|uniref:hypothetical protein n=1 Tax=Streptomyces sp. NPDC048496 TaxID=3365558 RepID=UPI00371073D8